MRAKCANAEEWSILDDEAHATIICQSESIMNCRPVTVENLNDPKSLSLLTPNHLFTIKT